MKIILITGGNKGLGYEAGRRLMAQGHKIYIGARDPGRGKKAAQELGAKFIRLDVTDDKSVESAAQELAQLEGHLDVLINNAGISGGMTKPDEMTLETIKEGTDAIVKMAMIGNEGPTETFSDRHGAKPW
jgi:NAD(P)-dependent dehydrogenase (short-subunit alcohol dehydrogenase family)